MQFSEERNWQRKEVTNWKLELFENLRSSPSLGHSGRHCATGSGLDCPGLAWSLQNPVFLFNVSYVSNVRKAGISESVIMEATGQGK
jgi:hypothetical protein